MRRFPRAADHFEALEPCRLQSASPAPGDGYDYVMLATAAGAPVVHAEPQAVTRASLAGGFAWFDASPANRLHQSVPGVVSIVCDDRGMFPVGADGQPIYGERIDEPHTRYLARVAAQTSGNVLVLDIEHWSMNVNGVDQATANRSAERFAQIIDWCRDEVPTLKIGIYGELPTGDVWASAQLGAIEDQYAATGGAWEMYKVADAANIHARWQAAGNFLRPLAAKVDYMFPSLYTFYSSQPSWVRSAKAIIDQARTFGRPVIPFVWPKYHNASDRPGQSLEPEFWALQLDTLREHADGGVIWDDTQYAGDEPWVAALDARRTSDAFLDRTGRRLAATTTSTTAAATRGTAARFGTLTIARDDDDAATSSRAATLLAA